MTRRVSKHGTTYTEGSKATFENYPRVCHGCGDPVRITGLRALWFETDADGVRSWHVDCRLSRGGRVSAPRQEGADARQLDELYATLPDIECKGLCARSCGPIMAEVAEANACGADYAIVKLGSHEVALFSFDRKKRCHLLRNGRCTAYKHRPAICRLWGVVESMPCMYGCVPGRYLTDAEGRDFLAEVRRASRPEAERAPEGDS